MSEDLESSIQCFEIYNGISFIYFEDLIPEYTVFSSFPFSLFPSFLPCPLNRSFSGMFSSGEQAYKPMKAIGIQTITNTVVVSSHLELITSMVTDSDLSL